MTSGQHRVLISTSLRSGRRLDGRGEEVSGALLLGIVDVEEETFRLQRAVALPPSPHRPGRRSVRGVAPFAGGVAACTTSQLFLLDPDLREIRATVSDRRFGDLHAIVPHGGLLWVTATAADAVVALDAELRIVGDWWAGDEPALSRHMADHHRQRYLSDHDFRLPEARRDRFHVNHVAFDEAGDLIVSLPDLQPHEEPAKFWNVNRRRFHLADGPPFFGRIHDGEIHSGHHYFGWTEEGCFVKVSRVTGTVTAVDCRVPLGTSTGNPVAAEHGWLRGAALLGGELFLVGQSKLTLFLVDMATGARRGPLRRIGFGADLAAELDDPGLAVYCIARWPWD